MKKSESKLNIWRRDRFLPMRITNIPKNLQIIRRNIKYSYQRIVRGFADLDAWDLDYYYTNIITGTLNYLADHHTSIPYDFEDTIDENPNGWEIWLRETANYFTKASELEDEFEWKKEWKEVKNEVYELRREGLYRLFLRWNDLWD